MVYLLYRDMGYIHNQHKNILDYYKPFSYPLNVFSVQAMDSRFHILTDIVFYRYNLAQTLPVLCGAGRVLL